MNRFRYYSKDYAYLFLVLKRARFKVNKCKRILAS